MAISPDNKIINAGNINASPEIPGSQKLNIKLSYPQNDEYEFLTQLIRYNLDDERKFDILNDRGFIVSPTHGIKKDMKDPDSIFSPKFGQTLKDVNSFANRYKCQCGHLQQRINWSCVCEICGKPVKYVDDDFEYFGWLVLQDHYYINMAYFQAINFFIGKDLDKILCPKRVVDEDGFEHDSQKPHDQPYYGIGMTKFREDFDEIMKFYLKKKPAKISYYNDIMTHKKDVFTQSIPVFTTLLRPFYVNQQTFSHEDINGTYTIINKMVWNINSQSNLRIQRSQQNPQDILLYTLQTKIQILYDKVVTILSGKRGAIRSLFGGRCNYSGRNVIVANPDLRIDQVTLPYQSLITLLSQTIINILHKSYNMSYNDAYTYWYNANITENSTVVNIINNIIKESNSNGRGLPIIINRNPTINYGSILQCFCVGMTDTYTMAVPLQILPLLAADFDGDVLNILLIINDDFKKRAFQIFNPRNTMYISRNDGQFNNDVNHQKDTLINANTFIELGRDIYTAEDLALIEHVLKANEDADNRNNIVF